MLQELHQRREKPGWRCPSEMELAAYTDNRLGKAERQRLQSHLADCAYCLDQVASLARLGDAEILEQVPADLVVRARELPARNKGLFVRWHAWAWTTGAATAGFLLAVALWVNQPAPRGQSLEPPAVNVPAPLVRPPSEHVRSTATEGASPELIFPQEGARISPGELEFRWAAVSRSLFYEVRILDEDGGLLWEGRTEAASLKPPATLMLKEGRQYYISVRANLPEGQTIRSRTQGFITSVR